MGKLEKMIKQVKYINPKTGEFTEKVSFFDNIYQPDNFAIRFNVQKIQLDPKGEPLLPLLEQGLLMKLIYFMDKNNIVMHDCHAMQIKDMVSLFDITRSTAYRLVTNLVKWDYIRKISYQGEKCFIVNPFVAVKGKRVSYLCYMVYLDRMQEENIVVPKDLTRYSDMFQRL